MSLSKLYRSAITGEKVIIGEYRSDIEADQRAEARVNQLFMDVTVLTTIEGKKMVPIQELLKIEQQFMREKDEALKKGYEEGFRKGVETGHREAQEVVNNFAGLIKDATNQREVLYEEARSKILELVILVANRVTCEAAQIDPDVTAAIINNTIDRLVDKTRIKIKVHPDHLPLIEQQIDRFKGDSAVIKEIIIEPDKRVRYGGCFIETPTGDIDARVESQMGIIAEAIGEHEEGS
jgi:flagellar biosynthesis/type III secretory pathway protein FliH